MERRMAALFVLALLLIFWQAWRTKPLARSGFFLANDPGAQLLPTAAPSWRGSGSIPADAAARLLYLEDHAVRAAAARPPSPCRLFLRISAYHWFERPLSTEGLRELTLGRPGRASRGGSRLWSLPPAALLDDVDGDGDVLDRGELAPEGPGAEAEVFCGSAAS
jgi:hypothetical protein